MPLSINQIDSVEIYSKPGCPFCVKAKELLESRNVPYDEYMVGRDVSKQDIQSRVDAMNVNVEIRTVPQIFAQIGNDWHYIGGFDELNALR